MKLLILGKSPPIEGGVSATTYWTANILAEAGHEVHLCTNANEVEWRYKMWLDEEDRTMLTNKAFPNGGKRMLYATEYITPSSYIPWANPFVSKLSGSAARIIEEHQCDLIYAHYLEPYGVAAAFLASLFKMPYAIRHAGSDIGRLSLSPSLKSVYRQVLQRAAAVITSGSDHFERLKALGATDANLVVDSCYSVLTSQFYPKVRPMNVSHILNRTSEWLNAVGFPPIVRERVQLLNRTPMDPAAPIVGIYGKIGETKGTFDLIRSLGPVFRNHSGYLVIVSNGTETLWRDLTAAIIEASIEGRVRVLPFLPHWKIPSFIRSCRVTCFLERDFPIVFHSPVVPREILACGVPLVCSEEIRHKCAFRASIVSDRNMMVVDPRDTAALGKAVGLLLEDGTKANAIGYEGYNLSCTLENEMIYRDSRTKLFTSIAEAS